MGIALRIKHRMVMVERVVLMNWLKKAKDVECPENYRAGAGIGASYI
jgi:hypothetical protein